MHRPGINGVLGFDFSDPVFMFMFSDRPVVQSPSDHPQSIVLTEGETASFYCKTTGNPPATAHKWQFNGNDLPGESCSLCTSTTLIIRSVAKKDEGWYGCVGSNSMGEGPRAEAQLSIKRE